MYEKATELLKVELGTAAAAVSSGTVLLFKNNSLAFIPPQNAEIDHMTKFSHPTQDVTE